MVRGGADVSCGQYHHLTIHSASFLSVGAHQRIRGLYYSWCGSQSINSGLWILVGIYIDRFAMLAIRGVATKFE